MANKYIHNINGNEVPFTEEEITARKAEEAEATNGAKLKQIKQIRLQKLKETDWYSNSDVTMPDNIKTWRQSLRDLPQDFSTEEQYDLLLARDEETGELTHSIWSKP